MTTVSVYNYDGFSIVKGVNINHGTFATIEFITKNKLTPILKSKMEVPISRLDVDGRYIDLEAK